MIGIIIGAIVLFTVGLVLYGAFKTPEALKQKTAFDTPQLPLPPLGENLLAYLRLHLNEYELPEDRYTVAQLCYIELEAWAKEGQEGNG